MSLIVPMSAAAGKQPEIDYHYIRRIRITSAAFPSAQNSASATWKQQSKPILLELCNVKAFKKWKAYAIIKNTTGVTEIDLFT